MTSSDDRLAGQPATRAPRRIASSLDSSAARRCRSASKTAGTGLAAQQSAILAGQPGGGKERVGMRLALLSVLFGSLGLAAGHAWAASAATCDPVTLGGARAAVKGTCDCATATS